MQRRAGWLWAALVVPGCVGYQLLVHSAIMDGQPSYVRLALASLPLLGLGVWIARHARRKVLWMVFLLAAAVAVYAIERETHNGLTAAYGVPHAAIYLSLLWMFGRTVMRGREPLITGFARQVHGTLPPEMAAYTRRVTQAWCVFFAAQPLVSAALFMWAPLDMWSLFVNVLNLPLVAFMFAAEYLYRVRRYRDFPHASIMKGVRMFTEHESLSDHSGGR
ncbi:MAG TPA: hypothetical protein VD867_17275 [Burkholderiales bacterium]|nr:hypothetical protein [Burkholderiales bacterium]